MTILGLLVDDAGDGIDSDHADWAEARFIVAAGTRPQTLTRPPAPKEAAVILTPKPGPEPRINGPKVYGCRPGNPFLYRIPTTGARPISFSAKGLPAGLNLDRDTGIITGTVPPRGEYAVTFTAKNRHGSAKRQFKIVAGDTLALTPPMGWNHWYAHYDRVTDKLMREAADVMVSSGMADVGYQYVNIDDCWMNAETQTDPLRVGPAPRRARHAAAEQAFPRHEGAGGLHPRQRPEGRALHLARPANLRRFCRRLAARGAGREALRRLGL